MKIFGIVGWKNTGKTYFAQQIISNLLSLNFRVASIKHAHHDFEIDQPNTDSYLLRQAGSEQVIISSTKFWPGENALPSIIDKTDLYEKVMTVLDAPQKNSGGPGGAIIFRLKVFNSK